MTDTNPATAATTVTLAPRLVVADAASAIDWYARNLGATELERYTFDGRIAHASLAIGSARFHLKDADGGDRDPLAVGETPVLLSLNLPSVEAVDRVASAMAGDGAEVIFEVKDRPGEGGYGGRLRDPFGHVWVLGHDVPPAG